MTIFLLTTLSQRKTRVKLCTAQFLFNSSKGDLSFLALLIFIVDVFRQVRILVGLPTSVDSGVLSSSSAAASDEIVLDFLPEKPTPLPESSDSVVQWVGDPPLEALGLASWWPSGRMQYFMEYLHVGCDLPWWGVIIVSELILILHSH